MFFKIAVCGVAFVSNDVDFWTGSTSVERETLQLGVYLTEYQLVKQRIGVISIGKNSQLGTCFSAAALKT